MSGQLHALVSPWLPNVQHRRYTPPVARIGLHSALRARGSQHPMTRPVQRRQGEREEVMRDCSCYL